MTRFISPEEYATMMDARRTYPEAFGPEEHADHRFSDGLTANEYWAENIPPSPQTRRWTRPIRNTEWDLPSATMRADISREEHALLLAVRKLADASAQAADTENAQHATSMAAAEARVAALRATYDYQGALNKVLKSTP
jgi:hypothetical protein